MYVNLGVACIVQWRRSYRGRLIGADWDPLTHHLVAHLVTVQGSPMPPPPSPHPITWRWRLWGNLYLWIHLEASHRYPLPIRDQTTTASAIRVQCDMRTIVGVSVFRNCQTGNNKNRSYLTKHEHAIQKVLFGQPWTRLGDVWETVWHPVSV